MTRIYRKSQIIFSVFWIILYIVLSSVADIISEAINIPKLITAIIHITLSAVIMLFLKKNSLLAEYGISKPKIKGKSTLFYIPLVFISSTNLWFGTDFNMPLANTLFYTISMLFVGFLEEIIFRGFLFKALAKNSVKSAVIVSSLTFGFGHIINLFNGSGAGTIATLCQVVYATAVGFLFVVIFLKSKSLLPCIFAHSTVNALSAFSSEASLSQANIILTSIIVAIVSVTYSFLLIKISSSKIEN